MPSECVRCKKRPALHTTATVGFGGDELCAECAAPASLTRIDPLDEPGEAE